MQNTNDIIKEELRNEALKAIPVADNDSEHWFVLRVTYQRELIAHNILLSKQIRSFVPIRRYMGRVHGRIKACIKPVLHNYIFIYSTFNEIRTIKMKDIPYLRYIMCSSENGQIIPMTVPNWQMENFILAADNADDDLKFYTPGEIDLKKGDRVRVLGGVFAGLEGIYVRIKQEKKKRVVIEIPTLIGVATSTISPELVEKI